MAALGAFLFREMPGNHGTVPVLSKSYGWRSLSGKMTHKVAHNDASISERNLKADSDHDQERLPHCHRINCTFWVMHNHAEIVRKCRVYWTLRVWAILQHTCKLANIYQWLCEFNSMCRVERVYIGSCWPDSRNILIVSIALVCQFHFGMIYIEIT